MHALFANPAERNVWLGICAETLTSPLERISRRIGLPDAGQWLTVFSEERVIAELLRLVQSGQFRRDAANVNSNRQLQSDLGWVRDRPARLCKSPVDDFSSGLLFVIHV